MLKSIQLSTRFAYDAARQRTSARSWDNPSHAPDPRSCLTQSRRFRSCCRERSWRKSGRGDCVSSASG
eukprot:264479-Prymnesium_polylepis.1